ncbi:hypothetical protein EDD70_0478 [Hydrogenoanaerobacterium saccharovorans]|uniref:SMEK domain-containing protein n=1 Tax=Hydrogenoanaerobacterium saccharovorans TaxID=474960 RepID=A0A1H8B1S3_9FIRM|nr:SMEK domain-containing protein [Hydrogenoanaerobacterium saccharovorans]RPF47680.1 hypothetical protein EDD70_0478 [Hydrogenoanaerobacterium saccharovorans]SEM75747.1 hypothetical protein SAMN05216180_1614 [Hydrogenoanaerobacterium saccharovorans]
MKDSDKRIQFIADYISAYEQKIKLLNNNGLFDSAKLFELFAIEVGSLYFGQKFSNLNIVKPNYPYVDLISADKKTYIQVSTEKGIPKKIKKTLENIRDSKLNEFESLTNVKFMVLNNESIDKVKDYVGKDKIGQISFTRVNDLVTTRDILQKSESDIDFQIALYNLLKKESESIKDNEYKFKEAIENSKSVGLGNIDCKINNEYEVDRSKLISKIKEENHKNISIQGGPGSGKSVLCKKIVEEETNLIYAKAELFLQETDINNIWGFNVRKTLEYLNGKVVFFIDSLEFIADNRTKLDLLCVLYECTKDYPATKIITSCRTSDKNAFIKIESNYSVHSYEIPELMIEEQLDIAKKYSIIKKMFNMNSYVELLKSPFYINLIVSKITDIDNICDENQLREYIWQHIICLNDSKYKKVVESIVFTRAKDFSLGATSTDYDKRKINKLISEGVLVKNGSTVRLKYDIFEDICFEQHFDNEFNKCKGNYNIFFNEIEILGRCIYRRYQIWISNKLLEKDNREKFLFELVFSDKMPPMWRKQTEIGLVKSRYCEQFFSEYGQAMIDNKILNNFIKTTNLYAFEIMSDYSKLLSYIRLRPSGKGRQSQIHLIVENNLYKKDGLSQLDLEKLCTDYSKIRNKEKRTAEEACIILEYFIDKYLIEFETKRYYKLDDILNRLLVPIYQMAEYSQEWIKGFWGRLNSYYKGDNRDKERLSEDIIENTLKVNHMKLAEQLPTELCNLAEMFWTFSPREKHNKDHFDIYDRYDMSYQYGLSENAEHYEHGSTRNTAISSNFFYALFKNNFWIGLNWTIEFVNKVVLSFAKKNEGGLPTNEIKFIEQNIKKSYLGLPEMWLVTTQEHRAPTIISDLIYCLKEELRNVIENDKVVNKETAIFAENVKKLIYEKTNNIALLTIIADIGMEFRHKLPGYALDLATNIDIILIDLEKLYLLKRNPFSKMLEKQIFMTVGMPFQFPDRYNNNDVKQYDLITYIRDSQIYYGDEIRIRCHTILDYLYSIVPNNKENAIKYLQIQKMDLRIAKAVKVDDTTIALIPTITGEAEKVIIENEKQRQPDNAMASLITSCNDKLSKDEFGLIDCLIAVEKVLETKNDCVVPGVYDKFLVDLFTIALNNKDLDADTRSRFCQMWIDGIKSYFSNGSFIFEYSLSIKLFEQIETDVCTEIKNQIKQLIVDLILFKGNHGVVAEIARYAKRYLSNNERLARAVFNTIVKLAEDKLNRQKFNAEYMKQHRQNEKIEFASSAQPKLLGANNNDEMGYQSKKDEIIREYLFNNTGLNLSNFDMNNYDIATLCYAINCGLSLDDTAFAVIVKKFVTDLINLWKSKENTYHSHDILGVHPLYEVMKFFQRELIKNESETSIVLNILFTDVDFSKFTHETIEFYLDVFGSLLSEYFDSHSNKIRRANCVKIIRSLEEKIVEIKQENVRIELYKSLMLSITNYGGAGDWSKCPSGYSYQDKQFLNALFSKYGRFHLKEMLDTIYKLHLDKLLPEILLSVRDVFRYTLRTETGELRKEEFAEIVRDRKTIILTIITKAFLDFGDEIKQDDDLTKAFEEILEMLVEISYEEAATILDEFRVH